MYKLETKPPNGIFGGGATYGGETAAIMQADALAKMNGSKGYKYRVKDPRGNVVYQT